MSEPGATGRPEVVARNSPRQQARARTYQAHAGESSALAEVEVAFHRLSAVEAALDDAAVREIHRRRAAVDAAAARSHYTLAVLGRDVEQRTRLLGDVLGEDLVAPAREDPLDASVRFRHGSSMGYRARFSDGTIEDFSALDPDRSEVLGHDVARARGHVEEVESAHAAILARIDERARAMEERREELAGAEGELERLERQRAAAAREDRRAEAERRVAIEAASGRRSSVPNFVRSRPPWWALWAWVARVLVGWRYKRTLAEAETLSQRAALLHPGGAEADGRSKKLAELMRGCLRQRDSLRAAYEEEAQRRSALEDEERRCRARMLECNEELERAEGQLASFVAGRRARFAEHVRALTDANARATELESLQVELESVPPDVEIVDVGSAHHALDLQRVWELVDREADGCAIVGELPRQALRLFGGALRSASPDLLAVRLRRARVLRATRHAAEACKVARQSIEAAGARAVEETRRRVESLHKQREADARRLEDELLRVQAEVKGRAASALSQAVNHIEWALDRLQASWLAGVRDADSLARLRASLASVETEASEALETAAVDARALLVSTLSGIVAELVRALAREGSCDPQVALPNWDELEIAIFPSDLRRALRVAPSRFGAHLQALETTRAACEDALRERLDRLRRQAVASLMNLEPQTATHLQGAVTAVALALHQARERGYQQELEGVRAAAATGVKDNRAELLAEIAEIAARLEEHERELAAGL
jgi:hypothetical protein